MSIAEMKLAAIEEISKLNEERELKEILEHLSKLSVERNVPELNLSRHYNTVKKQYNDVLAKLAK